MAGKQWSRGHSCCRLPTLLVTVSSLSVVSSVCACMLSRLLCVCCVCALCFLSKLQFSASLELQRFESCYVDRTGRGSSNKHISRTERKFAWCNSVLIQTWNGKGLPPLELYVKTWWNCDIPFRVQELFGHKPRFKWGSQNIWHSKFAAKKHTTLQWKLADKFQIKTNDFLFFRVLILLILLIPRPRHGK